MSALKCDHCLLSFPERDAVRDAVDGQEKVFCCSGCRGVFRLIHGEGLDEFYRRREGWTPGPPEEAELTTAPFLASVRREGDGEEMSIHLSGIRCASCIWLIERYLSRVEGIKEISVNYATHRARIRWTFGRVSLEAVLARIKSLGYIPRPYATSQVEENLEREKRDLLVRFGTASFFSMQLMLYTTALYAGYFQGIEPLYKKVFEVIAAFLAAPVMFYCGYPFLKNTARGLGNRAFTMDTLVFLGSFSAYAYSIGALFTGGEVYFDTSAMIITLILLGRYMEAGAKSRATQTISSLFSLQSKEARLLKAGGNGAVTVPVSSLKPGDRLEVIPGEKIPIDSTVIGGNSEVNEAMITGEAMPVGKERGGEVFGGTLNLSGRLLIEVKRTAGDTVLARIIRAVEDAQARKAPLQKTADRVVGWFVPAIIGISIATFFFRLAGASGATAALMNAISVVVIACPCALGLATPLAVFIGSSSLSSKGILVKGGDIIESVARSDFVCFDKTGTLTAGTPSLIKVFPYGTEKQTLHVLAASLEKYSGHSIAKAIRKGVEDCDLCSVEAFRAHPGRGVEGVREGVRLAAGNIPFLESLGVVIGEGGEKDFLSLSAGGDTVTGFAVGKEFKGWFVISDELRPEAPAVIESVKRLGRRVGLLTGDQRAVAENIGERAGIPVVDAEVLPLEKAARIRQFKESGRRVVMVGDGINDAPALTEADVGVAFGNATDVAIESAGVVLMRNDLRLVPAMIALSGKTLAVIRQNLFWAFSYNIIAIPLAVSGMIHPILSAAFMASSSLIVVGNSLRLRRMKMDENRAGRKSPDRR
ncbi:MAG: heavy metal translocating P-type ATPase [Nitrospirae bacterium]|nr:heavy metal translocating P-type ATPase [Nitrospirota bacterium]